MHVEITRIAYLADVTLGKLRIGNWECCTLEEPWRPNPLGPGGQRRDTKRGIAESCVPDGDYILKPHAGSHFKDVYRLSNHDLGVYDFPTELPSRDWGRASVLIHNGNTTDDILGCILVGMVHNLLDGKLAVLRSTEALAMVRALLGHVELHSLSIRPHAGTA